ncbi:MAG: hypothetical protein KY460_10700 [Actinobacteria bacterium]|nr:hypothetical protein [Actinomycetota bacterium]
MTTVRASHVLSAMAGAGIAVAADRALRSPPGQFARMSGSTLASMSAAAWITDFLNAAYYAKDRAHRDLDDLRLAFTILTTYWHRNGSRQLGAADVVRFHRALGTARLRGTGGRTGTLDTASLLDGGAQLLGDWFPDAVRDRDRRGWGIAFPSVADKAAHDPEVRLAQAMVGPLTPPRAPVDEQVWHTYPPVEMPDAAVTAQAVLAVEQWPDYASELGRFTPLRRGGLAEQTFEIEVVGFPSPRTPVFTRGYVTITTLVTADDAAARDAWVDDVRRGFAARPTEASPIPEGAQVHAGFDLTCHERHFMGNARNRLVLYTLDDRTYLRAAGTWDPMERHLAGLYYRVGRHSQHAFWGMGTPQESMLHQIAAQAGATTVDP